MKNFGIGYKGSKNLIAQKIIDALPTANNFYDLFCGGGAISHCAMLSQKYNHILANDIQQGLADFFARVMRKDYKPNFQWVSREDFFQKKDSDWEIKICYSFGNGCDSYLYGKEREQYKKALHYAIVNRDYSQAKQFGLDLTPIDRINGIKQRRLEVRRRIFDFYFKQGILKKYGSHYFFKNQKEEPIETQFKLESLERLESACKSYDEIEIDSNSVVYCDIPYRNTSGYEEGFDYEKFYDWARNQKELTVISEYTMPSDFVEILAIPKRSTYCASANLARTEKLFVPKHQAKLYEKLLQNNLGGLFQ